MGTDRGSFKVVILGTADSKLDELLFLRDKLLKHKGCSVLFIDVGKTPSEHELVDVNNSELLGQSLERTSDTRQLSRAEYIKQIIPCATAYVKNLFESGTIHGIVSIGGSSGTSLASAVMRNALPFGFPKLLVSTMASGNVKQFIEETDITLMYSVVDIAGVNSILRQILSNAAGAISGMALSFKIYTDEVSKDTTIKTKRIGVTMFGLTTPCVDAVRHHLETKYNYEVYVFHATGAGGTAMERLIKEGKIDAVLDVTTTEIADELVGGVLTAGPDRLAAAASAGIPQIVSVGACDMVNFGPKNTIPSNFASRKFHEHNPAVTLIRTTPEECTRIGDFIAQKLCRSTHPGLVEVILPVGGISGLSTPGEAFYNPEADSALFEALASGLKTSGISVRQVDRDINNVDFALLLAESLVYLIQRQNSG